MTWPLTGLYTGRVNPKRVGAYLVRFDANVRHGELLWFDGRKWWYRDIEITHRAFHWCGLAFDPAAAQECLDIDVPFSVGMRPGWWVPKP